VPYALHLYFPIGAVHSLHHHIADNGCEDQQEQLHQPLLIMSESVEGE
jgi:hypothetical protein